MGFLIVFGLLVLALGFGAGYAFGHTFGWHKGVDDCQDEIRFAKDDAKMWQTLAEGRADKLMKHRIL